MPDEPDRGRQRRPEVKAVADEGEPVGRRKIRVGQNRRMNRIDRHRHSPPRTWSMIRKSGDRFPKRSCSNTNMRSAAELTLGRWHLACRPRIARDSRAQRPRQTLDAGFGDMVSVLAIYRLDVK